MMSGRDLLSMCIWFYLIVLFDTSCIYQEEGRKISEVNVAPVYILIFFHYLTNVLLQNFIKELKVSFWLHPLLQEMYYNSVQHRAILICCHLDICVCV